MSSSCARRGTQRGHTLGAVNLNKLRLAHALSATHMDSLLLRAQRRLLSPYIRCVNYHDIPPNHADDFERQLRFYAREFAPVDEAALATLRSGGWSSSRPGVILSFDDGLRSHADVVAPLLDAHGFVGWFMVPPAFLEADPRTQRAFAEEHRIDHSGFDYGDSRIAMTWEDVRGLDAGHVVGSHSWDHTRLSDQLSPQALDLQTSSSKHRLEGELGHEITVFAWVGGEDWSYSRRAADAIERAGFTHSFTSHSHVIRPSTGMLQLPRTNVEAWWPDEVVRFQLSGFMDLYHNAARRRVNRRIAG